MIIPYLTSLAPPHLEGVYPTRSEGLLLDNLLPACIIPGSSVIRWVDLMSQGSFQRLRSEGRAQQ